MRWLFRHNLSFVQMVVVQTGAMWDQMLASYPELEGRVTVVAQPSPSWCQAPVKTYEWLKRGRLTLLYPVAGYPHKNHALLNRMNATREAVSGVEVIVSLSEAELGVLDAPLTWVRNVGRLDPQGCLSAYQNADALFFPSLLESYGLPLVEAMTLGLPVVCSDLPYARWLCGDEAIYFDPLSAASAWQAIGEVKRRLAEHWRPDWRRAMAKLPGDWDQVARRFLDILDLPARQTAGSSE
jgi:hypothetical protein